MHTVRSIQPRHTAPRGAMVGTPSAPGERLLSPPPRAGTAARRAQRRELATVLLAATAAMTAVVAGIEVTLASVSTESAVVAGAIAFAGAAGLLNRR